ncbi:MAG: hypothetical protein WBN42_11400, partial [Ignavibacteriaceae bacterium]
YFSRKDYNNFAKEMRVIVSQYPSKLTAYDFAASQLINVKEYDLAFNFLIKRYKENPDAFTAKWLGNISLNKGLLDDAIQYLNESVKFDNSDAQVYYNLAGAFIQKEEFDNALKSIGKCIKINPEFPNARTLKVQLTEITGQ